MIMTIKTKQEITSNNSRKFTTEFLKQIESHNSYQKHMTIQFHDQIVDIKAT